MRPTEATSQCASMQIVPASALAGRFTIDGQQPFASVLQATRQSSQMLMRMLSPAQVGEAGPKPRDADKRNESPSSTARAQEEKAFAKSDESGKNQRSDRHRSAQRERTRKSGVEHGSEVVGAYSQHSPLSAQPVRAGGEVISTGTWTAIGNLYASTGGSMTGAGGTTATGERMADIHGANASGEVSTSAAGGLAGTRLNQSQNIGSPHGSGSTGVMPVARVAGTDDGAAGHQRGSGAGAQESPMVAAVRAGAVSGRTTGGSEFQRLLSQFDRSQPGTERGQADTVAVKPKAESASTNKTVDLKAPGSIADLARIVRTQVGARQSSMVLELSPAELGRVRVDVRMQDSTVSIQFAAETWEGQREIKSRLNDLKGALEQQGIVVDRVSVESMSSPSAEREAELSDHPEQNPHKGDVPADGRQSGRGNESMSDSPSGGESVTGENDTLAWASSTAQTQGGWSQDGVDLTV